MAFGFDPTYSAYLRAMGVEEAGIRAQARQQSDAATRQVARQDQQFTRRLEDETRGIGQDFESRGLRGGGAYVSALSRSQSGVASDRNEVQATLRDQLVGFQTDAASQVARLRREGAEKELEGRGRAAESAAIARYGGR